MGKLEREIVAVAVALGDLRLVPWFTRLPVFADGKYCGAVTCVEHGEETLYEVDRFVPSEPTKRIAHGTAPSVEDAKTFAARLLAKGVN